MSYLDAVEEALCFGWIDGIAKRYGEFERAQRFTPRRPKGTWTELNKERARRLERQLDGRRASGMSAGVPAAPSRASPTP